METQTKTKMEQKKRHWRSIINPDYLGAYSLDNGNHGFHEIVATIESAGEEEVTAPGGSKSICIVAKLKNLKPMVVNSTNSRRISAMYGSNYVEDWAGKDVTLYVEKTRMKGQPVEGLRVRPQKPNQQLPELKPGHPRWEGAVKSVSSGNAELEDVLKKFTVSEENQQKLCGN